MAINRVNCPPLRSLSLQLNEIKTVVTINHILNHPKDKTAQITGHLIKPYLAFFQINIESLYTHIVEMHKQITCRRAPDVTGSHWHMANDGVTSLSTTPNILAHCDDYKNCMRVCRVC